MLTYSQIEEGVSNVLGEMESGYEVIFNSAAALNVGITLRVERRYNGQLRATVSWPACVPLERKDTALFLADLEEAHLCQKIADRMIHQWLARDDIKLDGLSA